MTESQARKLNGKYIRFTKQVFPHSVATNEYEGYVEVSTDMVSTPRHGGYITKEHTGFYLDNPRNKIVLYFDFRAIKLIEKWEIVKDVESC